MALALAIGLIAAAGARAGCDVDVVVTMRKPVGLRCTWVLAAFASTGRELGTTCTEPGRLIGGGRTTGVDSNNISAGSISSWSSSEPADGTCIVSVVKTERNRDGLYTGTCGGDEGDGGLS